MYPAAYKFDIKVFDDEIRCSPHFGTAKNSLNLSLITISFNLNNPYSVDFRIVVRSNNPENTDNSGVIGAICDRFINKDPINYSVFSYDPARSKGNWVISSSNLLINKEQAISLLNDFFMSLFEPDLLNATLPFHKESLLQLIGVLNDFGYKLPPVRFTEWAKRSVFFSESSSIADSAAEELELKREFPSSSY